MSRGHALLVFHSQISSFINEELAHLEAIRLDSVVDGPLILCINHVSVSTIGHQLLYSLHSAFPHGVVNGCLAIFVLLVDLVASFSQEVVDHVCQTLTTSVEEWALLERVLLCWLEAERDEHSDHFKRELRVSDYTCCEDQRLIEILSLIYH